MQYLSDILQILNNIIICVKIIVNLKKLINDFPAKDADTAPQTTKAENALHEKQ